MEDFIKEQQQKMDDLIKKAFEKIDQIEDKALRDKLKDVIIKSKSGQIKESEIIALMKEWQQ